MRRTGQLLLQPTARQAAELERLFAYTREVYNAALEERIGAWRWERRPVSLYDQQAHLTGWAQPYGISPVRGALRRLDRAFVAFYRRCKVGETPGFPRFKGASRWDSVEWREQSGWKITDGRLYVQGVGHIKIRGSKRGLPGRPVSLVVRREGRRFRAYIACAVESAEPLPATGRAVGLDRGISVLAALSTGELVNNDRWGRRAQDSLTREQRSLATKKRGSQRRCRQVARVAAAHRKVRNQRRDALHKLSRRLINDFDVLVIEDLKVRNMVRRPKPRPNDDGGHDPNGAAAKAGLNRSIHDAGWSTLASMLTYKAEDAGREVIVVNAAYTSQTCALCGHVDAGNRDEQKFRCLDCGHVDHADVNAAVNILRAGLALRHVA